MRRILPIFLALAASAVSAFASIDTGLLALVPANSKVVAGIDVQKCRNSQFGQYLLSKSQASDAHFDEFMTETGFDPRRDLESMLITATDDGSSGAHTFAILARGTFDQAKIRALAISKGATTETFQGVSLLEHKDHGQTVAMAFPDVSVAVMGDVASVHQAIQNLSSPAVLDVDLTNRIDAVGSANDAWFVSTIGGAALGKQFTAPADGGAMSSQAQALKSIRAASAGVVFGTTVAVMFNAATRSEQDAMALADVVRLGASMVQMQRQQNPQAGILAASLDNMQLNTSGDSVHLAFSMSEKNLEQMAELGPQHRHPGRQ